MSQRVVELHETAVEVIVCVVVVVAFLREQIRYCSVSPPVRGLTLAYPRG